jgi:3',5'-cyclic AMP phosphodiesterase CpdA
VRIGVLIVVALVAGVVGVVGLAYRDQIVRYATHLKGSPTHTVAWQPFPADKPPELHLAVAGDVGDSGSRLRATAAAVARIDDVQPFDGLVLLGDNVYPSGDPGRLPATVFTPFAEVLDHVPPFAVLGNHDVKRDHAAGQVAALGMPGRWWAHDFGDVLLIGLDSNLAGDPTQQAWLADSLAAATERWRIVVLHHPPYSAGYQGSDLAVRRAFVPLFERYGVQLVVSGHDHDYQRSTPIDGVTYVVTGGAAGTRRTGEDTFTAVSFSRHHFVELAVFDDRLVIRAVNQDRRVADEAVLHPTTRSVER